MSYRRRHRWFRRMALGLAFSVAVVAGRASVAAAKIDEGQSRSYYVSPADPLTDVFVRPGEALGGPDGGAAASELPGIAAVQYESRQILGEAVKSPQVAAVRPDDLADRFAHSDAVPRPELASSGSTVEWNEALTVGIGALVLTLGLGLAVGYLRRPRLVGM